MTRSSTTPFAEAAKRLGCSASTLYEARKRSPDGCSIDLGFTVLPVMKIGSVLRIPTRALDVALGEEEINA